MRFLFFSNLCKFLRVCIRDILYQASHLSHLSILCLRYRLFWSFFTTKRKMKIKIEIEEGGPDLQAGGMLWNRTRYPDIIIRRHDRVSSNGL